MINNQTTLIHWFRFLLMVPEIQTHFGRLLLCRPLPHSYQSFVHISRYIVLISSDSFSNVRLVTEHAKVLMKFKSYSMKSRSLNCQALGFTQHKSRSTILIIFIVTVSVCLHKKSYHKKFSIRNILVLKT